MAPGAFERAHPSPRANADPGPTGGTAPDSPRAFLAAMEDGVYGRSGRGGAGWERMERFHPNVPLRTFPGARRAEPLGPVVAELLWGAGRASGGAREQGVPGHCLGRACFRWRREGAGWSGGGEAGAEPFPLEGPGEPSACWEPGGGLLGRLGGEKSWGLQRSR